MPARESRSGRSYGSQPYSRKKVRREIDRLINELSRLDLMYADRDYIEKRIQEMNA